MSHCLLGWNNKGILIWTRGNLANRARSAFHLHGSRGGEEVAHLPSFRFTLISFDIPQRERGSVWDVHYYSEGVCVTDCASLQPLWIHITPDNPSIQSLNNFIAAVGTCLGLYFTVWCLGLNINWLRVSILWSPEAASHADIQGWGLAWHPRCLSGGQAAAVLVADDFKRAPPKRD